MKHLKRALSLSLVLILLLALCACGGSSSGTSDPPSGAAPSPETSSPPEYAGKYGFHCAYLGPVYMDSVFSEYEVHARDVEKCYVVPDLMTDYYITLDEDGTGYLFWGEDNQGPIDWWKMDGDSLEFQAGEAVTDGSIVDGYMSLEVDEDFDLYFALPDAVTPDVPLMTMDEYVDLLYGEG